MKITIAILLSLLSLSTASHARVAGAEVQAPEIQTFEVQIPEGQALTEAIRNVDADLFQLFFQGCDPDRLLTMVSPDLEFYHDKGGVAALSGREFVEGYAKQCELRKAKDAWHNRRELILETFHVDPIPSFGAMATGEHYFYERQGKGPEKRVGKASFAVVWKLQNGAWKLHRVLSYSHAPAP